MKKPMVVRDLFWVLASCIAVAAPECSGLRIDAAGSDGYRNEARCGGDALALGTGKVVVQKGGFVELLDGKSDQATRLRCDGWADRSSEIKLQAGTGWQGRVAMAGCSWRNDALTCSGRSEPVCVVERVHALKQNVAVYATVQVRALAGQNDSVAIREWLDKHAGKLDHCRRQLGMSLPLQLNLKLAQAGQISLPDGADAASKALGTCVLPLLNGQPVPAGMNSDYALEWRLEGQ
ncbi:hypothetical protein [Chitinimonas sp.]|uniref:hypothetical protein n=1 Tax=Chitinimonas sp. TaxID=1934313 RepID=UPI0035B25403